jgi:glycosyltransferase involved in cell wall biosynthesis
MAQYPKHGADVTVVAHDVGGVGGMERQLNELIVGLIKAGSRVTVISRTCDMTSLPNLRWIRVRGPSRPFVIAYPWFFLMGTIITLLRKRGVTHSTGAILLSRTEICTVHFCHHAASNLTPATRASRSNLLYRINAWISWHMKRIAERYCYRPSRIACLVGVSGGVVRELETHFPAMRERLLVVANGVDTDVFHPAVAPEREKDRDGPLAAIFVGSEWNRKGLDFAIESLVGCPNVALTVVGEGDVESYRDLARRIGVDGRVEFVGPSADVSLWYRRADVFLLPTAYETFSLVAYEAAASGLPLLVTKVNGVEDLLRDGENGWFIERDTATIRPRLRKLAADRPLTRRMGARARVDSMSYSWTEMVRRYRALYGHKKATDGTLLSGEAIRHSNLDA